MNYGKGQEVVIRRNLGEKNGREKSDYYHGGDLRDVPLGSKAVIEEVFNETDIYVRLQNGNTWNVHPDELATTKGVEEAEKKKQEAIDSKLEGILNSQEISIESSVDDTGKYIRHNIDDNVKENHTGIIGRIRNYFNKPKLSELHEGNPFHPEFNAREEYAVWVRQEFPELKEYAENEKKYGSLEKRKEEVMRGAEMAYNHGTETIQSCALSDFTNIYSALKEQKTNNIAYTDFATNSSAFSTRLEKFVSFIEFLSLNLNSISSMGREKHHGTHIKKRD